MDPGTVIFVIMLRVTTLLGGDYYVQPTEAKYQRAFADKLVCAEFSRPLVRAMKTKSMPPGITLEAVTCRALPMEASK